jgi:hypothetical protein
MPLADLSYPTTSVSDGHITFDVGPLSIADIADLRRQHVVQLLEALHTYKELLLHPGQSQRAYGAASVFLEMADAVAHVIALAAREPERLVEASRLPLGTQIQALTEIIRLSLAGATLSGLPTELDEVVSQFRRLRPEDIN